MSSFRVEGKDILAIEADCIVNAAPTDLSMVSGVSYTIFQAAGPKELQAECSQVGKCEVGNAVITNGCKLAPKKIIHTVTPRWSKDDPKCEMLLYRCYLMSLDLAVKNGMHSIVFPLLGTGAHHFPQDTAWRVAMQAIRFFLKVHYNTNLDVTITTISKTEEAKKYIDLYGSKAPSSYIYLIASHKYKCLLPEFGGHFTVEGITYTSATQYIMAKKALLFRDYETFTLIMHSEDPLRCVSLGKQIKGYHQSTWKRHRREIAFNANLAKISQNEKLMFYLRSTTGNIIALDNSTEYYWGIGIPKDPINPHYSEEWTGENVWGEILMEIRKLLASKHGWK